VIPRFSRLRLLLVYSTSGGIAVEYEITDVMFLFLFHS